MQAFTNAIVLRAVPYGETSLVVTAYTRAFGLQSYMVKGARSTGKKGQSLRPYLQPSAILELVVYHHSSEHLQYLREVQWARVYRRVLDSVIHYAVATFMVELMTKSIRQTEPNAALYDEIEAYFVLLDEAEPAVMANLPLHFALFMAGELGFRPENNYDETHNCFSLKDGFFTDSTGLPDTTLTGDLAILMYELLQISHPVTLYRIKMNRSQRQEMMRAFETFFGIHIPGFGLLRSPEVLAKLW